MNGSHQLLIHAVASQRSEEIRASVERERLVRKVNRVGTPFVGVERVRRMVGDALVGTGNLVGGRRAERPVEADRATGAAVFRIAR